MSTATILASMSEKLQQTVGRFNVEEATRLANKPLAAATAETKKAAVEELAKQKGKTVKVFAASKTTKR